MHSLASINWNSFLAIAASVVAILGTIVGAAVKVVSELRQNRKVAEEVNRRVTTPPSTRLTLAEAVTAIAEDQNVAGPPVTPAPSPPAPPAPASGPG